MRFEDLSGRKFNRLIAVSRAPNKGKVTRWLCNCDCGNGTIVASDKLKSGHTKSCGCFWVDKCVVHGHTYGRNGKPTRTFVAWSNMRSRAKSDIKTYRKVSVCKRWIDSFENFLADMGECPPGMTLDRYPDNAGNYKRENCRWATPKQQTVNRRVTIFVVVDGKKLCLSDACAAKGVNYPTIRSRVRSGMDAQVALNTPIRAKKPSVAMLTRYASRNAELRKGGLC